MPQTMTRLTAERDAAVAGVGRVPEIAGRAEGPPAAAGRILDPGVFAESTPPGREAPGIPEVEMIFDGLPELRLAARERCALGGGGQRRIEGLPELLAHGIREGPVRAEESGVVHGVDARVAERAARAVDGVGPDAGRIEMGHCPEIRHDLVAADGQPVDLHVEAERRGVHVVPLGLVASHRAGSRADRILDAVVGREAGAPLGVARGLPELDVASDEGAHLRGGLHRGSAPCASDRATILDSGAARRVRSARANARPDRGAPPPRSVAFDRKEPAMSESRKALHELIDLLREVDQRFLGPEWNLNTDADVAEGTRAVMHMLQGGLSSHFEDDPDHPTFRKIVSPTRKFTGDNPDAIYFEAPVRHGLSYRVRGKMAGAVYVSITVETGPRDGTLGAGTNGVINDTMFDVAADGSFEIALGGPAQPRNWLVLPENANRITTRHYFEEETFAAADDLRHVPLSIEIVGGERRPIETPERSIDRRGGPPGRGLPPRADARHAADGEPRAAGFRVEGPERIPEAGEAGLAGARRLRCGLLDGALRDRPRPGARAHRPLAAVPLRLCLSLDSALDDVRLRESPRRPQSKADPARAGRLLPDGDRPSGSGRAELARQRGAALRNGLLALLPAGRRDRDTAGEGRALRRDRPVMTPARSLGGPGARP